MKPMLAVACVAAAAAIAVAARPKLATSDDAIDRFIAAWQAEVVPTIKNHKDPLIKTIDRSMRERDARKRYHAEAKRCRDATHDMEELIKKSGYDFVLYGSMAEADKHDRCWAIAYICCMKADAGGVVDADTGKLLAVWRIPEG
jgi:hypothetical protein